jgi:hypothetical protein
LGKLACMAEAAARPTVDEYIGRLPPHQVEILKRLRALIRRVAPEARESIKWAQPVYESNGPMCYVRAFSKHVNVGFWRGADLTDPAGLLKTGGDRMAHVSITEASEIREAELEAFVREALRLNAERGDPTKRASRGAPPAAGS